MAKNHGELVAPDARQRIGLAHAGAEALADLDEQLVADGMAIAVVHQLESVEVDVDKTDRGLLAARERHALCQAIGKQAAIGQTGELVDRGLLLEARLGIAPGVVLLQELREHGVESTTRPAICSLPRTETWVSNFCSAETSSMARERSRNGLGRLRGFIEGNSWWATRRRSTSTQTRMATISSESSVSKARVLSEVQNDAG